MATTGNVFPTFFSGVNAGDITMPGGTWKVALGNAAGPITLATSGISTAKLFTDWTSIVAEITGAGYTAGGATVSSPTFTLTGANNSVTMFTTATNPQWTSASFNSNQAVLYQSSASTYQLAAFWDFGGSQPSTATFTLQLTASGLVTVTTA